MIGVHTDLEAYAAAVAELPATAVATRDPSASIVVVTGSNWTARVRAAWAHGAAAVVVADPASPVDLDDLAALVDEASARPPVVVARPRLRTDAGLGGLPADHSSRALVAECAAPPRSTPALARDAIGWLRVLSGGALASVATDAARVSALAHFTADAGTPATLVCAAGSRLRAPFLRAVRLGERRIEVLVEADARHRVTVIDEGGAQILPRVFESVERAVLRRAVALVESPDVASDLSELLHDESLAAWALNAPSHQSS